MSWNFAPGSNAVFNYYVSNKDFLIETVSGLATHSASCLNSQYVAQSGDEISSKYPLVSHTVIRYPKTPYRDDLLFHLLSVLKSNHLVL